MSTQSTTVSEWLPVLSETPMLRELTKVFEKRYGTPPDCIVQAPGRVNLIGEHIDYSGYGVLPMALEKTVQIAVAFGAAEHSASNKEKLCEIQHANDERFPRGVFSSDPNRSLPDTHAWYSYVQCGYKGAWLLVGAGESGQPAKPKPTSGRPMRVLVTGTIPLAAGLSSSSALVVASTVAALQGRSSNGNTQLPQTLEDIADLARQAERYIGTMGGGMDQASSVLGGVRRVEFGPLRTTPLALPASAVFVVAQSLAPSPKAVGAELRFNLRVVETLLAAKALATKLGMEEPLSFRTLKEVHEAYAQRTNMESIDLNDMAKLVEQHLEPGGYTESDLNRLWAPSSWNDWFPYASSSVEERERIEKVRQAVATASSGYKLRERALHVYTEAARVRDFAALCRQAKDDDDDEASQRPTLEKLGALMTQSHESCQRLYECSCPELDELVACCVEGGALGARLTGAGWGGATVALVEGEAAARALIEHLHRCYYPNRREALIHSLDDVCFVARPSPGVSIYHPPRVEQADQS